MNCRATPGLLALFIVASGQLSAQVPLGDEARVSNKPDGDYRPELLSVGGESAMALWFRGFSSSRIRARVFNPLGEASQEFEFGDASTGGLSDADANSSGDAVFAYGGFQGPFLRRFRFDGSLLGPELSAYVEGYAGGIADLFVREDGTIVLAYTTIDTLSDDSTQQISFRIFDASGSPLTGRIQASTREDVFHYEPRVDGDRDGNFTIAWSAEVDADFTDQNVYYRRFDRLGNPLGPPTLLSESTEWTQYLGGFSCDLDGRCAAAWQSFSNDTASFDIFFRIFDPSGAPETGDLRANQYLPSTQFRPALSMNRSGEIALSWTSEFQAGGATDIYARLFRRDGTPASDEFRVNQAPYYFVDDQSEILLTDEGSLRVAWVNFGKSLPGQYVLMTRRFLRGCPDGSPVLTLAQGRYEVCARWETPAGAVGSGQPIALREESGGFWFFDPANFELLVKAIDGCDYNQAVWTFAAGLTNVGVDLSIHDLWTGRSETYWNPPGQTYLPVLDIGSLPVCEGIPPPQGPLPLPASVRFAGTSQSGSCAPDATHLCLQGGRFRVAATWTAFDGSHGDAVAAPFQDASGPFWFFGPENLELAVKVIDACVEFDRFWVFAAGLTNVEVHLTVVDTESGEEWRYDNPLGAAFPAVLDSQAFATCQLP